MSQEKKAAQTIEVTEEEAQQAIADIDLILNDPEMARKFTRNLLELGGLKDKPSQERLHRVCAEFRNKTRIRLLFTPSNNRSAFTEWVDEIIKKMLEALYINPTADGTAHTQLLKELMWMISLHKQQMELSVQGCLEDCFKLFSKYCNVEINTLLQLAMTSDSLEIAKFLIRHHGADIWKVTDSAHPPRSEESPLYLAVASASADFVQLLLEEGASTAYLPISNFPLPSERDKQFIVADYTAKEYTQAMADIESNIEELRRSVEKDSAMREVLKPDLLPVVDVVDIVSSYVPWGRDEIVDDKAVEKRDTIQPIPEKRVLYIQWAREKLRELAELIPVKTDKVRSEIEAVKNEVIKVLASKFLQEQCKIIFWRDLKTARKEDRSVKEVLPPGTIIAVAESKSAQVIVSKNPFALNFSGGHDVQDTPTNDNLATPPPPKNKGLG